jgi:Mn2+/Fe2+ NRAMP family transporter
MVMKTINSWDRVYVAMTQETARRWEAYILGLGICMALIVAIALIIHAQDAGAMPELRWSENGNDRSFPSVDTPSSGSVDVRVG